MGRFSIMGELFRFMLHRRAWWLIPLVVALLIVALLILVGESSVFAPFIYPLF